MLSHIVDALRCPVCAAALREAPGALVCAAGHAFDVARQGYVNLLGGDARSGEGDTAAMLDARERFLAAGHFAPITDALVRRCAEARPGPVLDVGAGVGRQLAEILDAEPARAGIALDRSKHAARRAARAHPRIGAVVADAWAGLPIRDGAAAAALHVFAPRNGPELARVLRPDGGLGVVVAPTPAHLAPLVDALGLITVDARKRERLDERLGPHLERVDEQTLAFDLALDHHDVLALVSAGPSARHIAPDALAARVRALPEPLDVPAEVTLSTWVSR